MKFILTFLKIFTFGFIVMGNITPPSDSYIEDDQGYNDVAKLLQTGWGWVGVNKASAFDSTDRDPFTEAFGTDEIDNYSQCQDDASDAYDQCISAGGSEEQCTAEYYAIEQGC